LTPEYDPRYRMPNYPIFRPLAYEYAEAAKSKVEADGIPEYVLEDEDDDDM
jgi:hypothetical protein